MTLIEVMVVVLVMSIALAMIWPASGDRRPSQWTACLLNVKQTNLGFIMYADDNHGKFAIQTSVTNGGTMEFLERNQTFLHYQKLSPYMLNTSVYVCPADKNRQASDSYQNLTDTNLSYFLNADVSTNNSATSIMAGERNLQADGQPVRHGTFTVRTNMNLTWTPELHRTIGVLGFADGHAGTCRVTNLNSVVQQQGLAAVRLSVP